jgi:hypothetical protein
MARSTFDGPVLSGDNRFGPFRNVGYADLVQSTGLNIANVTANTANYGGASAGVFVKSNGIPNGQATVFTPSSTNPVPAASTVPADSATVYRGAVMYIPTGSKIVDIFVDIGVVTTFTSGSLTSVQVNVSNDYVAAAGTCTYAQTGVLTSPAVGRQSFNAFTATQLANQQATSTDIVGVNGNQNLSQIVFTVASINGTNVAITGGTYYFTLRYVQPDGNIGTTTTYPFGNFD